MKALVLGFVVIIVAVLAVMPFGLGWGEDVLAFLRGSIPVIALLIGLILVFVGISDIKERAEAKKDKLPVSE
jgi:small neutral amino acid transporter SnatA (MarC family)